MKGVVVIIPEENHWLKKLRARYFWPTIQEDVAGHVKRCNKCQEYAPFMHAPPKELHNIPAPWLFHT